MAAAVIAAMAVSSSTLAGPGLVLASPGPSPFDGCTADQASVQEAAGSVLYPDSQVEPRSAIDPRDPKVIVGEYQQDRWSDGGARGLVASVSHDGGVSWQRVVVPGLTKCSGGRYDRASDAWVSFGPDGRLYAISLSFDVFDAHDAIVASTSRDGGLTWSSPIEITADDTAGLDKESITADPYRAGVVWATWDRVLSPGGSLHAADQGFFSARSYKSQTFVAESTDGGLTWGAPRQIFTDSSFTGSIGGMIRILPDGTLLDGLITYGSAAWKGGPCASISVLSSTDGGTTWSTKPTIIAPLSCGYRSPTDPDTGAPVRSGGLIDMTVSGSAAYAVWEDGQPSAPAIAAVYFSSSTDDGATWSAPIVVSKSPAGVDAFTPTIAVDSAGVVGVSYYDFRENTSTDGIGATDEWLVRCAASCSSASSWAETRVTPASFDIHLAPVAGGEFLGDYEAMTTDGTTFQPFFIGAPDGSTPLGAYFASLP